VRREFHRENRDPWRSIFQSVDTRVPQRFSHRCFRNVSKSGIQPSHSPASRVPLFPTSQFERADASIVASAEIGTWSLPSPQSCRTREPFNPALMSEGEFVAQSVERLLAFALSHLYPKLQVRIWEIIRDGPERTLYEPSR